MKLDLDSILYIVITIVVLVISGLGSRKRKKLQETQAGAAPQQDADIFEPVETAEYVDARPSEPIQVKTPAETQAKVSTATQAKAAPAAQKVQSPLSRLEEFITGQFPVQTSMEGESLETTVDEEEQILEEIRRSREEKEPVVPEKKKEEVIELQKAENKSLPPLFENVDEIKKAVIYSEVLNRKYT